MFAAAAFVVHHASIATVWSVTVPLIILGITFQVVGHRVFEQRQPALVDNPSHLLLGPMFVTAKLFIALGLRRDLAAIIEDCPAADTTRPLILQRGTSGRTAATFMTSAAHLKFLRDRRQIPFRNFKWRSGTGITVLLVPMTFRSS